MEKTEPLYFEGFKQLIENDPIYKDMVLIQIEPCAAETMRVIGMAERYVHKYERSGLAGSAAVLQIICLWNSSFLIK